ncbi:hypothetical protein [Clostridium sp.]
MYYFIKDNYKASIEYVSSIDIDNDIFGFIPVWRNTRNSIEAYYDIVNLNYDKEYISVMEYCSNKGKYNIKFEKYMYNGIFTIMSKQKISEEICGIKVPHSLYQIASKSNKYVHPNVFIEVFQVNNLLEKETVLKELLSANIYLLTEAYKLILQRYNKNVQPTLSCYNCTTRFCDACYQWYNKDFYKLLESNLFVNNTNSNMYSFNR